MKYTTSIKKGSCLAQPPYGLKFKSLIVGAFILISVSMSLKAQEIHYTRPSWYFGVSGGANLNYYHGTTQELNSGFTTPAAFHDGYGTGLYLAPLIEFHRPGTRLGFMLQIGYDSRQGSFDQVTSPCNCPADLNTDMGYITVEPSLRFAPFKSNFYLFGGPRFAFNNSKSFTYQQGINPAFPAQVANPDVTGNFSSMNDHVISIQIGAGFDIPISSDRKHTQFVISPFVSFQPYYGQDPRSIESWNITTVRAGLALKLGSGHKINTPVMEVLTPSAIVAEPVITFTVNAPKNIPIDRRVRETFPIRNYVFFDLGTTQISNRYVLLRKVQVPEFQESRLEVFTPKELTGRSSRQMAVYYNVLNILGDRMVKNPTTTVRLTGASMQGRQDGLAMAGSVKAYLVNIFGIEPSRINVEGRIKPRISSEQPGGTKELALLREGDRRVSIWSESPELLMEFQSGPEAPLRPVELMTVQEAPVDSYVSVENTGATTAFTSWSLEIVDKNGTKQSFGPYTQDVVSIPGKMILGTRPEGDYKVAMIGQTPSGRVIKRETTAYMVLWTPPVNEEMMRFSVLYEFNNSKAIDIYEKYLTDIVIPKIPTGATVLIHGHTDIIGGEENNLKLSVSRANDVKVILENGLAKAGRSDVRFEVHGFGEDQNLAPFENKYPEERFYNRTVIIDIIPLK